MQATYGLERGTLTAFFALPLFSKDPLVPEPGSADTHVQDNLEELEVEAELWSEAGSKETSEDHMVE